MPLPIVPNKFFEVEFIDSLSFKNKWNSFKGKYIANEPRKFNLRLINSLNDFKMYFEPLIDVPSRKPFIRRTPKLGGAFKLNGV